MSEEEDVRVGKLLRDPEALIFMARLAIGDDRDGEFWNLRIVDHVGDSTMISSVGDRRGGVHMRFLSHMDAPFKSVHIHEDVYVNATEIIYH
jgi:hypothetical protein